MSQADFDRPTRQMAEYAVGLKSISLSSAVVDAAVRHLLDSIGCAFGSVNSHPAVVARKLARAAVINDGSSVIGCESKTTPELAAFANTAMIRYLDFNDTGLGGHPSDMIPSILALAESANASGQDVIKSIVAAYEVVACLRRSGLYGDVLRNRGVDQVQSLIGSVVGAGMILGLDYERMAHAISLAITPNIPLRVVRTGKLSDWKGCATAHSSMMAVFAARLAKEGLTGPEKPFEGIAGFNEFIGIEPFDLSDLGQLRNGLSAIESTCFKWYPAEYSAQGPIGAILRLREEIDIEDIEKITVALHWSGWHEIGGGQGDEKEKWDPETRETADHSLPYILAIALEDGDVNLEGFSDDRIADPKLRLIMQKISVIESAEMTQEHAGELPMWPSITEVVLRSGKQLRQHSGIPKGHPLNPLSDTELREKFIMLSLRSIPKEKALALYKAVMQMATLENINAFTNYFRWKSG